MADLRHVVSLAGSASLAACSTTAPNPARSRARRDAPWIRSRPRSTRLREADIRRDIFALGGDAMRGREAGTLDEMRATGWVAERAREAGLAAGGG